MQQFLDNLKQFVGRLSLGQRIALGGVLIGGLILLISIAYWANRPDYALLFGNLNSADANSVVEALKEEDIRYDIRNAGSSIFVPRSKVYELRMRFASEGLISEGQTGYELFDQGTLGMTDFMQKLNKKRALEGELARTISNMRQVEMARVHLVMPERSPFREQQTQATASVVVTLNGGSLRKEQTRGISELVAGAVEGMAPPSVTVLDTKGNMLSDPNAGNPTAELTSTQLEMQRAVEEHLRKNGQSMLDEVLGAGNAIVRVSAELNFDEKTAQRQIIDPESGSIISEERLREENQGDNANSTVRNYEYSRTTERLEKSVGNLSYITVSVIVNHDKVAGEGQGAEEPQAQQASFAPRSPEELDKIESLVKNAVGFNEERGDRLTIQQSRFDTSQEDRMVEEMRKQQQNKRIELYIRYGLIALALLLVVWLIRSTSRRMSNLSDSPIKIETPLSSREVSDETDAKSVDDQDDLGELDESEMELIDDMYTNKLSAEAKARLKAKHKMYEEIKEQAEESPDEAADLIHTWLAENDTEKTRSLN